MSVENWNSSYKREKDSIAGKIIGTISLWVAMGLLWLSVFRMTEIWLQPCEVYWGLIIPWVFLLWVLYECVFPKLKKHKWIRVVFPTVNSLVIVLSLVLRVLKHADGLTYIVGKYVERFNYYYFTNLMVDTSSGKNAVAPILTGLLMVLWAIFWEASYSTKKRGLLGFFGIASLILLMILGYGPKEQAAISLFVAMILLFTCDHKGLMLRIVVPISLGISLFLTSWFFDRKIDHLMEYSDELIAWEQSLNFQRLDLSFLGTNFHITSEHVDNAKPTQTGRDVLYVYSEEKPTTSLYLRGFYATEYAEGTWKVDDDAFLKACKAAGYTEEEASKIVASMAQEFVRASGAKTGDFSIKYVGGLGDVAYLPYGTDPNNLDSSYKFSGDYIISKKVLDGEIEFTALLKGDLLEDPSTYTQFMKSASYKRFRQWYNTVADQYTQVPEGMDCIKEAAIEIESYMTDEDDDYKLVLSDEEIKNAIITNYHRNELVDLVRAYLDREMNYSTNLPSLPAGADAVEYALTQSHVGYCMHFATAAALILRELDVPVRYVSGYVAQPADFVYSEETGVYEAKVTDYRAHAWVEVYYEYIGWVPVEVTAALSSGSGVGGFPSWEGLTGSNNPDENPDNNPSDNPDDNPSDNPDDNPDENPDNNPDNNPDDNPDDNPSDNPEDNPDESPDNTPDDTPENVPDNEKDDPSQSGGAQGQVGGTNNNIRKIILTGLGIFVAAGTIAGALWIILYREKVQKQEMETAIAQKDGRKAVRRMNRRIYRMLRWKYLGQVAKIPLSGYITDEEYERLLKETFTSVSENDWARYMEIVKKMYYSQESISEEEMQHCHMCYSNPQMKLWSKKRK